MITYTPNQEKMLNWLEAGAPEVILNMSRSVCLIDWDEVDDEDSDEIEDLIPDGFSGSFDDFLFESNQEKKDESSGCGTVACIAGSAFLMAHAPEGHIFPSARRQKNLSSSEFVTMAMVALNFLGLSRQENVRTRSMMHDLFDPACAPPSVTPLQAAEALRRAIRGEAPWAENTDDA